MTRPVVSVIVPLYNLRQFVAEAIESALAQTLPPDEVEVIVIDDGSTDGGGEVVERYLPRVRYFRQENRGLSAARNAGIRVARAPSLTFLDADDRILPEKLAVQLDVFAARPDVGLVYSGWYYVDPAGVRLPQRGWPRLEGDVLAALVLGNLVHPHAPLVRREAVQRADGFDETLTSVEDWDLWLRITRAGVRWACVDAPLAEYRIRPDGMHRNAARMLDNRLRVLDKLFADPTLSVHVRVLRPEAYQNAYVVAACDHWRAGDHAAAVSCFRKASAARPAMLAEPKTFRRVCRWLLPMGQQNEAAVVQCWPELAAGLRAMLAGLFADGGGDLHRLRRPAALAYWRTITRFRRKHLVTSVRRALHRRAPRVAPYST